MGVTSRHQETGVSAAIRGLEATIQLKVSQLAKTGKEHTFRIVASASHQDRVWRQKTQPIHLTLTAPESESAAATQKTAAKPDAEKAKP